MNDPEENPVRADKGEAQEQREERAWEDAEQHPWDAARGSLPDTPTALPDEPDAPDAPQESSEGTAWDAAEAQVEDTPALPGEEPAAVDRHVEEQAHQGATQPASAAEAQPGEPSEPQPRSPALPEQAGKPVVASAHPEAEPGVVHAAAQRPVDPEDADDVMDKRVPGAEAEDATVLAQSRRQTRRAFLGMAVGVAAGYGFYEYLQHAPDVEMQPSPLRDTLNLNAKVNRALAEFHPLAPTYPVSRAETLRINGIYGLKKMLRMDSWRLQVVGVQNAAHDPRYVPDVTAWQYRYHGSTMGQGANHDTKVAPKADAAGGAPAAGAAPAPKAAQEDSLGQGGTTKGMPNISSSIKMAPMPMVGKAMADEKGEDDHEAQTEDDNHLGRMPRGMEESGESDSTLHAGTPGLLLGMADILKLPRHEFVTQFKCIEGWSQIVQWAGVRMADFLELYRPAPINGKEPKYVYMETPDGDYYTGYTLESLRHPQALLVTEMMGKPLEQLHGAPLRLHMPTKYGYKQIKRIALIAYTNQKPDDYWTKLGYDWYADL